MRAAILACLIVLAWFFGWHKATNLFLGVVALFFVWLIWGGWIEWRKRNGNRSD